MMYNPLRKYSAAILISIFSLFQCSNSYSQKINLDSLWKIWNSTTQADSNKLKAMDDIAWDGYLFSNPDSAFYFAQKEYDLATKAGFKKYAAKALNTQGMSYFVKGDIGKVNAYYNKCLEIRKEIGDKKGIAGSYGNIGLIFDRQGNYPEALRNYFSSLQMAEELGDKKIRANAYANIGSVYKELGNTKEALKNQLQALYLFKELGYKQGIAGASSNLGSLYAAMDDVTNAIKNYIAALQLEEELGDKNAIAINFSNLGHLYFKNKKYDDALQNYFTSLRIGKEIGAKNSMAHNYNNIGNVYFAQKKYKEATEYFKNAFELSKQIGVKELLRDCYFNLSNLDSISGNWKEAYNNHKLFVNYRDSLFNEENTKKAVQTQMQHEFAQQQTADKLIQEKKDAVSASEKQRQKVITIFISVGLLLVIIFSVLLFNRFRLTQKQKQVIEVQKLEVEEKNKQVTASINYARRIQRALLASDKLLKDNLPEHFIFYKPKDIVSGDFYWATKLESKQNKNDSKFLLVTADCTGHGVPGAFMSLLNISKLNEAIVDKEIVQPHLILNNVREEIIKALNPEGSTEQSSDGMDCTLCAFDFKNNTLEYAGAYNSFYVIRNNKVIDCEVDKMPVGKSPMEINPFSLKTIDLQKGDVVYTFTDGYADQFGGPRGKKFMYRQLENLLLANHQKPLNEQKIILYDALEKWMGNLEQVDDILIIGIKI